MQQQQQRGRVCSSLPQRLMLSLFRSPCRLPLSLLPSPLPPSPFPLAPFPLPRPHFLIFCCVVLDIGQERSHHPDRILCFEQALGSRGVHFPGPARRPSGPSRLSFGVMASPVVLLPSMGLKRKEKHVAIKITITSRTRQAELFCRGRVCS